VKKEDLIDILSPQASSQQSSFLSFEDVVNDKEAFRYCNRKGSLKEELNSKIKKANKRKPLIEKLKPLIDANMKEIVKQEENDKKSERKKIQMPEKA